MKEKPHRRRFIAFFILTLVLSLIILGRYFFLMVLTPASNRPSTAKEERIERGPILDRNGRILAIQNEMDSVEAWMPYVRDPRQTASLLGNILKIAPSSLLEKMQSRRGSLWIKRKITPTEGDQIRKLQEEKQLPGIYLRKEYGRSYPEQNLAAHLIGYAGIDNIGLEGLEYTMDDVLSPGNLLNPSQERYGNQIFLTLDVNIQYFTEKLAREAFEENNADSVTMLVMDAKNADILAYVSIPDFDPNNFSSAPQEKRKNRPIVTAFEPGSVFKVFSLASLMGLGGISPTSQFHCNGSYENDNFPGSINCLGIHGWVTPYEIIKYSCNAGASYASDTVTNAEFYGFLRDFGFGIATQLPLPGESNGLLRPPEKWSARSKPTLAMGQEILVSAVQLITAATVFTNGGLLLKPHVIDRIVSPNGKVIQSYRREPVRQVISPEVATEILLMMETATEEGGTAWRLKTPGIRVSSKTGTAQMADPETGKYSDSAFGASCLAIFPTDNPQYILYILIETPKGDSYYGGTIATPVVKQLIDELSLYGDIPRIGETEVDHSGRISLPQPKRLVLGEVLPDFTGFSKRELLPLFKKEDLIIHIEGEGWVVRQNPPPGTPLKPGLVLTLELE